MSGQHVSYEEFGAYRVFELLGVGAMGAVHRAQRVGAAGLERSVALKRLLPHVGADPELAEAVLRQARAAAHLIHPNIAQVYECGTVGRDGFIVREYIDGIDVRKLLRYARRSGEAIPLPVALSLLAELCDALEHAHTFVDARGDHRGVLHRDLSPSNLIVANTGDLKVLDFGLAKVLERKPGDDNAKIARKLGYLAPESALGKSISPASDVFSVGVIAYELLTTRPLFCSRNEHDTLLKLLHTEVPPPSQLNRACPAQLDDVILVALARAPEERIQSAADLRVEIDRVATRFGFRLSNRDVFDWLSGVSSESWSSLTPIRSLSQQQAAAAASQLRPLPLPPPPELDHSSRSGVGPRSTSIAEAAALAEQGHVLGLGAGLTPVTRSSDDELIDLAWGAPQTEVSGLQLPYLVKSIHPARRWRQAALIALTMFVLAVAAGVAFYKLDPPPPPVATLRFGVQPADSIVEIGGVEVCRTSPYVATLESGVYTIAVRHAGYKPWLAQVTLRSGESQTIQVALEPDPGAQAAP
jgi:serine/threonine protein kinase